MNLKFVVAMATYAAMSALAAFTLTGKLRIAVWILMGGLALKTLIAYFAHR
jgi:hypothetical protein